MQPSLPAGLSHPCRSPCLKTCLTLSGSKSAGMAFSMPALIMCAQHGRCLAGERPVWRLVAATISQGQGRHCEVGSGGSRRQTCDLRNTKPIRGCEVGRVGMKQRSPMQPKTKAVNWTSAQGKSAFLPGETCCQAFFLGVTLVEKSD